jgi:hypothetical protein
MARWTSKQLEKLGTQKKKKRSSASRVPKTENEYPKLITVIEKDEKDGTSVEHYINPQCKEIIEAWKELKKKYYSS